MGIKTDDLILCTVKKIEGTTVFVDLGDSIHGTIVFSEIAAGRIRNIREYAIPGKKIVCKVLKIHPENIELSFRRVTASERDAVNERSKQEQTFKTVLKNVVKDPESVIKKIKEKYQLIDFISGIKEDPKISSEFLNKEESEKLNKILSEKKEKAKEAKRIFSLRSDSDSGLIDLKVILNAKEVDISYLGSSQFSISSQGKDFKEANHKIDLALEGIKTKAKEKKAFFELKEK